MQLHSRVHEKKRNTVAEAILLDKRHRCANAIMMLNFCKSIFMATSIMLSLSGLYAQQAPSALSQREVLNNYYRAHGGENRVQNTVSLKFSGTITYTSREDTPHAFRLYKKRPNLLRYEIDLAAKETWVVSSSSRGLYKQLLAGRNTSRPEPVSDDEQRRMLEIESNFDGLLWFLRLKQRRVDVIPEYADGLLVAYRCEVFSLARNPSMSDTQLAHIWLDPESFLARKRTIFQTSGPPLQTIFKKYERHGGMPFPTILENYVGDTLISKTKTTEIQVNPGTLDVYFQLR